MWRATNRSAIRAASCGSDNEPNIDARLGALRRKSCRTKRGKAAKDRMNRGITRLVAPARPNRGTRLGGQVGDHRLERAAARVNCGAQLIERPLGDHLAPRDDADSVREPPRVLEN